MNQAFTDACGFVMPFGKYKGQTLGRIGSSDSGLLYADWLVGQEWVHGPLKAALETLPWKHPAMGSALERLTDDDWTRFPSSPGVAGG